MSEQDSNVAGLSNAQKAPDADTKESFVEHLLQSFDRYQERYPQEEPEVAKFKALLTEEPRCFERDCWRGHITGSAWVVNAAGTHALLTHHRKLQMWLQLGGHSDGDPDTTAVALREAREESGLQVKLLSPELFDVDVHLIPARKADPEHFHFDVRFALQAVGSEDFVVSEESMDLAWVPMATLTDYTDEPTMLRMRDKFLNLFS